MGDSMTNLNVDAGAMLSTFSAEAIPTSLSSENWVDWTPATRGITMS